MTVSELWRRVQNIVTVSTVVATQSRDGKMLVKVKYDQECTSDWLPVALKNNSFMKIWVPMAVSEQVIVFRPLGSSDGGIVFPSIFNRRNKEPEGSNESNVIVEFHDGARFEYDTKSGELKTQAIKKVIFVAPEIELECKNITITGDAKFNDSVDIDGALGVGGDIITEGEIEDARGDLTNFKTSNRGVRA